MNPLQLRVENISKTFVLHHQHGIRLPVLHQISLEVNRGECVVLHGHSGSGKSTLLRSLYANYLPDSGHIWIKHQGEWIDIVAAEARQIMAVRHHTVGWVSQFLRVIPRISALNVVMQPLLELGVDRHTCQQRAQDLLTRLNVPPRLWDLAPSTFLEANSNGLISPAVLLWITLSCCWMNRPHHWTALTAQPWSA